MEFPSDLESRMWHSLPLHLVASHSEEGYEKEAFAKEGTEGETCISIKPGLAGDWWWGAASTASVNGLQSRPLSLFFLFFFC